MTTSDPFTQAAEADHTFIVAGYSLRKAHRTLKPAYPKRKEKFNATVVFGVEPTKVTIGLCGAMVGMPALASHGFNAEIPYLDYEQIMSDRYEHGAIVPFVFGEGRIKVMGIESRKPSIRVEPYPDPSDDRAGPGGRPLFPKIADPMDGPVGLPLLATYAYIKRYGRHPAPDTIEHADRQQVLEKILKDADKLLRPLGLSRADIERLLDQRIGQRS